MHQALEVVTPKVSYLALLPLWAVLVPVIGAFLVVAFGKQEKIRNALVVVSTFISFVLVVAMYKPVVSGVKIHGHLYRGIEHVLGKAFGWGTGFSVDPTSLIFAGITSFIWLVASIYATSYMSHEHARTRFYVFSLLTLAVNLGVVLSKDFLSLFVFFELLTVFSAMLVLHEETKEALSATKLYIFIGAIGGFLLLFAILSMYVYTGKLEIAPIASSIEKIPHQMRYLISFFMIVGFGVKAGIFPVHVWLPDAHPIAPTPASALLSGIMVKAGIYGILRSVSALFSPSSLLHQQGWSILTTLGYALIWIGIVTMFGGMVNALLSKNCKRLLAYSTISQIGYIVLGIGCTAYLGKEGAMGLAGTLYHVFNHAIFKSALFLVVGVVYFRTGELDMEKLGGLWKNMPLTALICLVAVFSISGIPGFGGFASKTVLHHSIVEAYKHSAVFGRPDTMLKLAEVIFMVTAFGTFCYTMKLFASIFLLKRPQALKDTKTATLPMKIALVPLGAIIMLVGLWPNLLLEKIIGPALGYFGFDSASHPYHVLFDTHTLRSTLPILYDPKSLAIIGSSEVVHNLLAASLVVLGGGAYFVLGYRYGWFYLRVPEWTSFKYWYIRVGKGIVVLGSGLASLFDKYWDRVIVERMGKIAQVLSSFCILARNLNQYMDWTVSTSLVDAWLSRPEERIALPTVAEKTTAVSAELASSPGKEKEKASLPSLGDLCAQIEKIENWWDRFVTGILVDMWLVEPTGVTATTPVPPPVAATVRERWVRIILLKLCYLAKDLNYYLDRIISTLLVDMWLSEPIVMPTKGIKKGPTPRISVFRRLNAYLDQAISGIKVDIWQPEPVRAEEVVAPSIKEIKERFLQSPMRAYHWIRDHLKQIATFLLGVTIVVVVVIIILIALGYIHL